MLEQSSRSFFCISVMLLIALVPVLQAVPLNLPSLLPYASATGGVTINNFTTTSGSGTSTVTISNFNASAGSNRMLLVAVQANNQNATSVKFGSTNLSEAVGSFHLKYTAFWYLTNPTGAANIVVTFAGTTGYVVGAYALSGVDQANPIPTTATNSNGGNPFIPLNTEFSNSRVIDSVSSKSGSTLSNPTCAQKWNIQVANQITGASSTNQTTTPGYFNCSWTTSQSPTSWEDAGIEVKANGTSTPVTPIMLNGKSTVSNGDGKSATIYNFKTGSNSNRLLLVGVEEQSPLDPTSIKFGGVSLTKAISSNTNHSTSFWYLPNPSSTPANLTVSYSSSTAYVVGAYALYGVNQAHPIPTTATNSSTSGNPTISLTTKYLNSWVFDSPAIFGGAVLSSPTCTEEWSIQRSSQVTGASSSTIQNTPAKATCSWSSSRTGDKWDDVAIEVATYTQTVNVFSPFSYSNINAVLPKNASQFFTIGPINETGFNAGEQVNTTYYYPNYINGHKCSTTLTANSNGTIVSYGPTCPQRSANYAGGIGYGAHEGKTYTVNATGQTSHLSAVTTFVPTLTNGSRWSISTSCTTNCPKPVVTNSTVHLAYRFSKVADVSKFYSTVAQHASLNNTQIVNGTDLAYSFNPSVLHAFNHTYTSRVLLANGTTNGTIHQPPNDNWIDNATKQGWAWVGYDDECNNNGTQDLSSPNIEMIIKNDWGTSRAIDPCHSPNSSLNASAIANYTNVAASFVKNNGKKFMWTPPIAVLNATYDNSSHRYAYQYVNWNNIDAVMVQLQSSTYTNDNPTKFNATLAKLSDFVRGKNPTTRIFAQVNPSGTGSSPCNCNMSTSVYDLQYSRFNSTTPTKWLYDGVGISVNGTAVTKLLFNATSLGQFITMLGR